MVARLFVQYSMRVKVERHLRRSPTKMIFDMEENSRRSRKRSSHGSRPRFFFFSFLFFFCFQCSILKRIDRVRATFGA